MEGLINPGSSCTYNIFVKNNDQWHVLYGVLEYTQTSQIYKKDYLYNNKQYIIKLTIPQACSESYIRIFLSLFISTVRGPTFLQFFYFSW
jgi:hypothetical protein